MATTKTFNNVRLQLKYDSYSAWSTANPVLLAGEIAVTTVPTKGDGVQQVPAVLMKVGDGENHYNDLKFVSGMAANVHDWALAETKPVYEAKEITGLSDWINDTVVDTNTTYQIVKVDDYTYKLQYKELDGAWTDVAENGSIVIPKYDDTQVKADIQALQTQIGEGKVEEQIAAAIAALKLDETYDKKDAAATALTQAKAYTDTLKNTEVAANTAAITAIKDGETIDSFADVEAAIEAAAGKAADDTADALDTAKAYTDALKNNEVAAAQAAAEAAQGEVDALEQVVGTPTAGKTVVGMIEATQGEVDALEQVVGTPTEGKTIVEMIEAAQTAATYDDTQVKADIAANTKAIADNKADIEGKLEDAQEALQKAIDANASAIETLTDGVSAEEIDGVKDLIQYTKDHGTEVTGMKADIKANSDAIAAIKDGATELDSFADVEAKIKDTADAAQTAAETEAGEALDAAKAYTDALKTGEVAAAAAAASKAQGEVDALEQVVGTPTSGKTVVGMIEATQGEVDALEQKVGDTGSKTVIELIEEAREAAVESATYDDTEVRGLIKTNADDIDALEDRATALETNAVLEGDTLILNCGTSAGIA